MKTLKSSRLLKNYEQLLRILLQKYLTWSALKTGMHNGRAWARMPLAWTVSYGMKLVCLSCLFSLFWLFCLFVFFVSFVCLLCFIYSADILRCLCAPVKLSCSLWSYSIVLYFTCVVSCNVTCFCFSSSFSKYNIIFCFGTSLFRLSFV